MNLDLSKIKNVHFIGIGGIGISAIARMMIAGGKNVTGQDMQEGEIVEELKKLNLPGQVGIDIKIGQSYENIPNDTELVVYTIAIEYYDPKLFKKIKEMEIPALSYPEMLHEITKEKYTIAVSGTHGKTTTTGMIAQVLKDNGKDPTVVIGSLIRDINNKEEGKGTNFIQGYSEFFVVEACEYRRSFLNINPKILVITNIDEDHLDYYKDIEDIKSAFRELIQKVSSDGFVVCDPNDKNISDVIKDIDAQVINYREFYDENIKLKIPGIHNKKDGACSLAVADILGISKDTAIKALEQFPGTWRRFEYKGELSNGIKIYDDYGHHPTEIATTLLGFRELYPKNDSLSSQGGWKITVVFHPHLFSRTKLLLNDFAKCFGEADQVLILPIYYAREEDDGTISSSILADNINKNTSNATAFSSFEELEKYIELQLPNMNNKNIIITMGAGEAFKVGDFLLEKYKNR